MLYYVQNNGPESIDLNCITNEMFKTNPKQ